MKSPPTVPASDDTEIPKLMASVLWNVVGNVSVYCRATVFESAVAAE